MTPCLHSIAVYVHQIDPVAIGPVRWYGLSYLLGFVIGYLLIRRVARVGASTLRPGHVGDFVITIAVGVIVGGRLGYVLFYQPSLLVSFESSFPYWGLLAINRGGMASHGGIIGCVLAACWFATKHKHSPLFLIDLVGFGAPIGLFFGRVANFINGELYGRPVQSDIAWAVKFPQELYDWEVNNPARIDAVLATMPPPQSIDPRISDWDADTIIMLIQDGNQWVINAVEPYLTARHPSQIYAGLLEGLVVFAVLAIIWLKPRKPGTIMCGFFLTYGIMRIFNELFRNPDAHIGFQALGMTRGQWLSIPLVITGIAGLIWVTQRNVERVGSWRRGEWSPTPPPAPAKPPSKAKLNE